MKELKFRVWDKRRKWIKNFEEKDTEYLIPIQKNDGSVLYLINWNNGCYDWFDSGNVKINQFTGMTDINGKEIYEGDILRVKHPLDKRRKLISKVVVLNDIASFGVILDGGYEAPLHKNFAHQCEVIGNVYEMEKE